MVQSPWVRLAVATTMVLPGVVVYAMVTGRLERVVPGGRMRARTVAALGATVMAVALLWEPLGLGSATAGFGALQGAGVAIGSTLLLGRHSVASAATAHVRAVAVWIVTVWVSLSLLPTEASAVQPVSARVASNPSVVEVTVPFQGGNAAAGLDIRHRWRGDALVVWTTRRDVSFGGLAACLQEPCTETIHLVLDQSMPPGTTVALGEGPGRNARTAAAFVVGLAGLVAGHRLWPNRSTAVSSDGDGARTDPLDEAG